MQDKLDPIIAVKDLDASSAWYCSVFNWKNKHNSDHFKTLISEGEVMLCLHPWEKDAHPSMMNSSISPGNGLILYLRTHDINGIRNNLYNINYPVVSEIALNPNSQQMEFSVTDRDGYNLIISEYHNY